MAVPSAAGARHGRQGAQKIGRQALEPAAARHSKTAPSAQVAQVQAGEGTTSATRQVSTAPAAGGDEDLNPEDEDPGQVQVAYRAVAGKTAQATGAQSRLTVYGARGVTTTEIYDAFALIGLRLTDDAHEGEAVEQPARRP